MRLLLAAAVLATGLAAGAQPEGAERILSFHSRLSVRPDSALQVEETIKVMSRGEQIKRGIYRDFPTRYRDRFGNNMAVGFEVERVIRDGMEEGWHTDKIDNGVRVYIGRREVMLEPGEHTYVLEYRTTRQLGFFSDHDELYWNVTGNGWAFPIGEAAATVVLPAGASGKVLERDAYTGPAGAKGKAFSSALDAEGNASFATTAPLQAHEGITIVVSWPKGVVHEPTGAERRAYFFADNQGALTALLGLAVVLGYFIGIWRMVGKDPEPGTIVPTWQAPSGLSPAGARFVTEMGYDDKTFSAAVLSLAVKGYLTIEDASGTFTLRRKGEPSSPLTADEQAAAGLLDSRDEITLTNSEHSRVSGSISSLKRQLSRQYEKVYFLTNVGWFALGLVVSSLVCAAVLVPAASAAGPDMLFMCFWLTGWTAGVACLLVQIFKCWKAALFEGGGAAAWAAAGGMTLFAVPFFAAETFVLFQINQSGAPGWAIVFLTAVALVNYLFYEWLKAPTLAGRRLLDQIEGFKMFLAAAEKDRLNVLYPADKTPALFEKYLPYALALGVEQAWSQQFSDVLLRAGQDGRKYQPAWYTGSRWDGMSSGHFASAIGGSLAGAISSSSTAPGSSSGGGGGGSSGGGGGGGGGGGW